MCLVGALQLKLLNGKRTWSSKGLPLRPSYQLLQERGAIPRDTAKQPVRGQPDIPGWQVKGAASSSQSKQSNRIAKHPATTKQRAGLGFLNDPPGACQHQACFKAGGRGLERSSSLLELRSGQVMQGFPGGTDGQESACNVGDPGAWADPLEEGMVTHSCVLA